VGMGERGRESEREQEKERHREKERDINNECRIVPHFCRCSLKRRMCGIA
jgi:hypothetical protein